MVRFGPSWVDRANKYGSGYKAASNPGEELPEMAGASERRRAPREGRDEVDADRRTLAGGRHRSASRGDLRDQTAGAPRDYRTS